MNGLDLLSSSMRLINVLASGEYPSTSEQTDGLLIAQQMLDSWQAERLSIFSILISNFSLGTPALQQTYALGPTGDWMMPRPAKIERMSLQWLANPAQPLELPLEPLNEQGWQETVPIKAITSTMPTRVYDDQQYPNRNLNFWPIPTIISNIIIYGWQPLTTFPDLVTDVTFPPAYIKAIRYNLAVDLAPEFGREVPPIVMQQAMSSKSILKNMNLPALEMKADPAVVDRYAKYYNWITDQPAGVR